MYRVTTTFSGTWVIGGGITRTYFDVGGGTAQQAATAMTTFWTAVRQVIATDLTIAVIGAVETMNDATGAITSVTAVTGSSQLGLDDSVKLPPQTQGIIQLRTGDYVDGREVRGRIYLPAMGISSWSSGNYASGRRTTVEAGMAALLVDANSQLVVWQRPREAGVNAAGEPVSQRDGTSWAVTSMVLAAKTASLRSRRD